MIVKAKCFLLLIIFIFCANLSFAQSQEYPTPELTDEDVSLAKEMLEASAKQDFNKALECVSVLISKYPILTQPDYYRFYIFRCEAYIGLGEYEKALEDIDNALVSFCE